MTHCRHHHCCTIAHRPLIGKDYFDDAYTFESTLDERPGQHTFYEEDAGLSHTSLAGDGHGRGTATSLGTISHAFLSTSSPPHALCMGCALHLPTLTGC